MKFTTEPLHREPTDEIAGYRILRDGEPWEFYDPADRRLAERHCEELNRDFGSVTREYPRRLGQG
jgi:hypothetical protein